MAQERDGTWKDVDAIIASGLIESDISRQKVAAYFESKKRNVVMEPLRIRPDSSQWRNYDDHGDILVDDRRIEVKDRRLCVYGREIDFTTKNTVPYSTIFVAAYIPHERAEAQGAPPFAYVSLNRARSHVIVIHGSSKPFWKASSSYSRVLRYDKDYWFAPRSKARFGTFDQLDDLVFA